MQVGFTAYWDRCPEQKGNRLVRTRNTLPAVKPTVDRKSTLRVPGTDISLLGAVRGIPLSAFALGVLTTLFSFARLSVRAILIGLSTRRVAIQEAKE